MRAEDAAPAATTLFAETRKTPDPKKVYGDAPNPTQL